MDSKAKIWSDIEKRLLHKSEFNEKTGCLIWTGAKSSSKAPVYGKARAKLPTHSVSKVYFAHRLSYMCKMQQEISEHMRISHLCNKSLCIAQKHLHLEDFSVNSLRRNCFQFGVCYGHGADPDCIIFKVGIFY